MWTIAPIHVRRGQLPEGSLRFNQVTAGAAVATYLLHFTQRGPLDVVVRCAVGRFHFFVHIMRGRRGQIALYSVAGTAAHSTRQRVEARRDAERHTETVRRQYVAGITLKRASPR